MTADPYHNDPRWRAAAPAYNDVPSTVRDLTLDLTALAHKVTLAASLPAHALDGYTAESGILDSWEALTGLTGDAALEAAQAITRHPLPVTAAVVPF